MLHSTKLNEAEFEAKFVINQLVKKYYFPIFLLFFAGSKNQQVNVFMNNDII